MYIYIYILDCLLARHSLSLALVVNRIMLEHIVWSCGWCRAGPDRAGTGRGGGRGKGESGSSIGAEKVFVKKGLGHFATRRTVVIQRLT